MPFPDSRNLVAECSTREAVEYPGPAAHTFVVIDCGVKMNIIREAQHHGRVVQLPYDATPEDVARQKPTGVIISNGPGDPAHPATGRPVPVWPPVSLPVRRPRYKVRKEKRNTRAARPSFFVPCTSSFVLPRR